MTIDYRNPKHEHVTSDERWRRFVMLRRLSIFGWLGFFGCIALAGLMGLLRQRPSTSWLGDVGVAIFAAFGVVCWILCACGMIGATIWRCPACGAHYSINWYSNWPWRKFCAHCGWRHGSVLGGTPFQPSKR